MRLILSLLAFALGAVEEEVNDERFAALKKESAIFVKFYAPWCGHCKKLAPAWTELAEEINPDDEWEAKILSLDCTQYKSVCSENGVTGYPTLKLFYPDTAEGTKYQGARTKEALADWLDEKLAAKYGDGEEGGDDAAAPAKGEVVVLTEKTFEDTIKPAAQVTFVKFYAPWCGHCKKMAPTWIDLAKDQAGDDSVVIAEVDCTQEGPLCSKFGVKGYPTLKSFKDGKEIEKYAGARDISSFKGAIAKYKGGAAPAEKKEEAKKEAPKADDAPKEAPELTADNFAETVASGAHMIKFYAPWCGHCKAMAGAWEDLAKARKSQQPKVGIASLDCTAHNPICKEHGVKGFPTILFFQDGKNLGKHAGGRDVASLQKSITKFLNPEAAAEEEKALAAAVDDFNASIKGKHAFVKFMAPWCGHCKKLAPTWEDLMKKYEGSDSAVVLKIDCTAEASKPICTKAGVRGYPTLQYFNGAQIAGEGEKYQGAREMDALVKFFEGKMPAAAEEADSGKDEL